MIRPRVLLFVLLSLIRLGGASAGTTSFNGGVPFRYAMEVSGSFDTYKLPPFGTVISRTMAVIPPPGTNFLVEVILSDGAIWDTSNPFNAVAELTLPSGYATDPIIVGKRGGTNTITYLVKPVSIMIDYPSFVLTYNNYRIKDAANRIGTGGMIQITVQTRSAAAGTIFDTGIDTVSFLIGDYGVQVDKALGAGRATIDIGNDRKSFVGGITTDNTPNITINGKKIGVNDRDCNQFQLLPNDRINFVISGNLAGIRSIAWGGVTKNVSTADIANGNLTLSFAGDHPNIRNAINSSFTITVVGDAVLAARTLTLAVKLALAYYPENNRSLVAQGTVLTVWDLNGTVLTANWVNGNSGILNSRIYLWNPSDVVSDVLIQVYTLPNGPTGSSLLGTLTWGALPSYSGANIRLAEDILTPLGIKLPYTDNSGNLILVITTGATGVFGLSQTFSNSISFGTYPLKESASR